MKLKQQRKENVNKEFVSTLKLKKPSSISKNIIQKRSHHKNKRNLDSPTNTKIYQTKLDHYLSAKTENSSQL